MNALERVLEVTLARPCGFGAPLLHALFDGELPLERTRQAEAHVRGCEPCREHLRFLALEEQTIREIAAPTPARFHELWTDRLLQKIAAVVAEETAEKAGAPVAAVAQSRVNAGSGSRRISCSNVRSPTRSRTT